MDQPFICRWGIVGTGYVSKTFCKDLILDPLPREAPDVRHQVTAVGSRQVDRAQEFINQVLPGQETKAVTLDALYADPQVDVVYVGVPNTSHWQISRDALLAGKHVLCEKPVTFDTRELDELLAIAKENNLFFMEAVWTKFLPIAYEVQKVVFSGQYGRLRRIIADLSFANHADDPTQVPDGHRLIEPSLGGGALFDLGPYPQAWVMLLAYQNPINDRSEPSSTTGHMKLLKRTGVDEASTWVSTWDKLDVLTICTVSIALEMDQKWCVIIQMDGADIHVGGCTPRPDSYTIYPRTKIGEQLPQPVHTKVDIAANQWGMNYQADHVARCLRDGLQESPRNTWHETRVGMVAFDIVREMGGYPSIKGGHH